MDGDGLNALQELAAGTLVIEADSDLDGLSDGVEVLETGTDPNVADTDGDGLSDGDEVAVGLSPTSADSDGNGIPDAEETVVSSRAVVEDVLSVVIEGRGNVAGHTIATDESYLDTYYGEVEGLELGPFDLRAEGEFSSATLHFTLPEGTVAPGELVVARYNEELGTFEPLETSYDAATGTLSATTPHFSTYAVVRWQAWLSYANRYTSPGGQAMIDTAGCYANTLYRETLGGTWVDLPFTIKLDGGTFDRIPFGAPGVMQLNADPGHAPVGGH